MAKPVCAFAYCSVYCSVYCCVTCASAMGLIMESTVVGAIASTMCETVGEAMVAQPVREFPDSDRLLLKSELINRPRQRAKQAEETAV